MTSDGQWKRLYPIRYRHTGEGFQRWDEVAFDYVTNPHDKRVESCKVIQGSLRIVGATKGDRRRELIEPLITPSAKAAYELGRSLTAVRPNEVAFRYRKKSSLIMRQERDAYIKSARQADMLDKEVEAFTPTPYMLSFSFRDDDGLHTHQCGDWETHATFYKWSNQYGEQSALERMKQKFEEEYQKRGVVFVLGTLAKRPRQWTLLGVVRLDAGSYQLGLAL